jgi:hypothetical protein
MQKENKQEQTLNDDEAKRLADFFSLLIEIDKRTANQTKNEKQNN